MPTGGARLAKDQQEGKGATSTHANSSCCVTRPWNGFQSSNTPRQQGCQSRRGRRWKDLVESCPKACLFIDWNRTPYGVFGLRKSVGGVVNSFTEMRHVLKGGQSNTALCGGLTRTCVYRACDDPPRLKICTGMDMSKRLVYGRQLASKEPARRGYTYCTRWVACAGYIYPLLGIKTVSNY